MARATKKNFEAFKKLAVTYSKITAKQIQNKMNKYGIQPHEALSILTGFGRTAPGKDVRKLGQYEMKGCSLCKSAGNNCVNCVWSSVKRTGGYACLETKGYRKIANAETAEEMVKELQKRAAYIETVVPKVKIVEPK